MKKYCTCIIILLLAFMCFSAIEATKPLTPLPFTIPTGWPNAAYNFKENPLTKEGFELGKKLFYDGILSKDGNFPCASCHQQFGAFNNYDHNLSHGYNYQLTLRNAPSLQNLAWQNSFMWDGSIQQLDQQVFFPINAHNEMGETTANVLHKLNKDTTYKKMFAQVFGKPTIDSIQLGKALSQFMIMLVSNNSKYDKVKRGEASFTPSEAMGYAIFLQKCNSCHTEPLFTNYSFKNTGMLPDYSLNDFGLMNVTKDSADFMKFRVPSLRNAQVSFPYGHDGRFYRLYNAILHYNNFIDMPNTDKIIQNKLDLSSADIGRLITFINTLTDSSFLTNTNFVPAGSVISSSLMHTHN